MHAIPNHRNSNFQIVHFLVGSCHTPDGAYALLCNLKEEREMALAQVESSDIKLKAKILRAKKKMESDDEADRLDGLAELTEAESNKTFSQRNVEAARKELDFINAVIEKLTPYRKYASLSDDDAHQAAQQEEWKQELIHRAENHILTGGIPASELVTMRMHPEFTKEILPAIENIKRATQNHLTNPMIALEKNKSNAKWVKSILQIENKK